MKSVAMTVGVMLGAAGVASAQVGPIQFETESNDTTATANFLGTFMPPGGSVVVDGFKSVGDVDWFEFELSAMSTLTISTIGSTDLGADTQLQLVAGDGVTIIEFDDDDGPGLFSSLAVTGLAAGNYYIGVSSYADVTFSSGTTTLFDGIDELTGVATAEEFDYKLSIAANLVPAPASAALLGLGGLAAVRRRR